VRTGVSQDMVDTAKKRAYKVIRELERGLGRDDFEYEFADKYPFPDYMMLDMDELFARYNK